MKTIINKIFLLSFVFILTGFYSGEENKSKPAESPVAVIMKTVKDVTFKKESADWQNAKIGLTLITGDEVKTGEKSLALIKFTDNSVLRVREKSSVKIYADKKDRAISKNTYIDNGTVGFKVSKQQNEEFQFTTPTMVASIRGTEGYVSHNPDDSTSTIYLNSGIADVRNIQSGNSGTINGGQYATTGGGGAFNSGQGTNQNQSQFNSSTQTNVKKIVIKTNQGNLIIEYIGD